MANVITAADFATIKGGFAARSGRIDLGSIAGDGAMSAPTLVTDGVPFYQLENGYIAIKVASGTFTFDLWAGYVPNDGLAGTITWRKVPAATQIAALTATGGWTLPDTIGRPDRVALEVSVGVAGTYAVLISGGKILA